MSSNSIGPESESQSEDQSSQTPRLIVGIGASAGGLEALERLFETMPLESGMAFVVIQHLSPDFKSLTDDILSRRTRLPIKVVENGIAVRPDTVFLIPPRKDMMIRGGQLLLTDKDPSQLVALPIDCFFRSLAQEAGERAVAIILSGTGSDGSRGIRDIHEAGGLIIVQDPQSAKFDGMPQSALATGVTDLTLPPEAMPDALTRHALKPHSHHDDDIPGLAPVGLEAIFQLLRDAHGIDFTQYKPDTVTRRLERRLALNDTSGVNEYARRLEADPAELNLLYKDLLIGVTRFFRDEEAFDRLGRDVIPSLLSRLSPNDEFRAWVAGCATGEEAYSLAILVRECLLQMGRDNPVKIFATDAHRASLDIAATGIYSDSAVAELGPTRLTRFLTRVSNGYQISSEIRKMVVFAPHNVIKDAPFTKLDLVSCRNLLIYFRPPAQKRAVTLFHFALKTGGILVLGPSETTGEVSDEFETIDLRWKVYRKRRDIRLVPELRPVAAPLRQTALTINVGPEPSLASTYDSLLDEFMPPSFLINDKGELIQSFAGASRYLKFRDGRISTDLLELVDPELRTALTGALPRALKELVPVSYKGLNVSTADGSKAINVTVRPVRNRRPGIVHALVQIEDIGRVPHKSDATHEIDLSQASREQILALESELRYTKENLQAMIEEMETSNEELQATNEELVASNEELQSTNEELHSVNEELYTVNGEYQKKIVELTEMTADLDNLLASTEVHTLFLDRELCIRKFTLKIGKTFNLLPHDVGRPFDHFTHSIDYPDLLGDLRAVSKGSEPVEHQVRDLRGNWFLLRILPYRAGSTVEGVVLTLIDLARIKEAEAENWRLGEQLTAVLQNSPNWVYVRDLGGRYVLADESFKRAIGRDPVGKTAPELFPPEVASKVAEGDDRVLKEGVAVESEVRIPLADGPHTFLSVKFPLRDQAGRITGMGGIKTDVTAIRQAQQSAQDAVIQRDRFLAMLSHELRNPLAAVLSAAEILTRIGGGTPQSSKWLGVISRRARHMTRLVDDLLDVARFTQSKIEIRKSLIDLRSTVADVLEEVRVGFDEAGLQLIHEVSQEPHSVLGDPVRLQQVQVNLLRNAAKYTPHGGRVWYTLQREGDQVVIRVRDTGVGLTNEMRGKVFEPFVQADETLDRAGGGIGLGLTLVRSIVELHAGTVQAQSEGSGKGSEFVVKLPLYETEKASLSDAKNTGAEAVALPASTQPNHPSLKVLIVEDDRDIRSSLLGILEMEGHQVRSADEGTSALAILNREQFDVALLDIGLPGMSGYELARAIREKVAKAPVLIALTGYGRTEDRAAAEAAGFNKHLTKPFRPEELSRLLAAIPTDRNSIPHGGDQSAHTSWERMEKK